jgi:hypothetical protein
LRNILKDYGILTIENVQAHSNTYLALQGRSAQNNMQLYNCLVHSLTETGQNKIMHETDKFTDANGRICGVCYLKVIIDSARVETNATTAHIRTNLSHLDSQMYNKDYNIIEFNNYVKGQVAELNACGETSNDLLINLFAGYTSVPEPAFVQYITKKRDLYDEGQNITPVQLMAYAENKYKTMVQATMWKPTTQKDDQFVALAARLEALHARNVKVAKNKAANKVANKGFPPAGNYNKKKIDDKGKKAKPANKGAGYKGPNPEDYAWKKVPPTGGQTTIRRDGKTYHWCHGHAAWTLHSNQECRLKADGPRPNDGNNQQESLRLAQAFMSNFAQDQGACMEE